MEEQCLQDRDDSVLAVLLSNKANLQMFGVYGIEPVELKLFGRSAKGSVTDQSIEVIVEKVGNTIQELNFQYQSQITQVGLETILRGCPLLRNLVMIGVHFTPEELERLLPLSNTPVQFIFGDSPPYSPPHYREEQNPDRWMPVILATEGRTILLYGRGEVSIDKGKLPLACIENAKNSKELIAMYRDRYDDTESTNMWDFLL